MKGVVFGEVEDGVSIYELHFQCSLFSKEFVSMLGVVNIYHLVNVGEGAIWRPCVNQGVIIVVECLTRWEKGYLQQQGVLSFIEQIAFGECIHWVGSLCEGLFYQVQCNNFGILSQNNDIGGSFGMVYAQDLIQFIYIEKPILGDYWIMCGSR